MALLRPGSREGFSAGRVWRGIRCCELGQCRLDLVLFVCSQRLVAAPRHSRIYRFSPFTVLFRVKNPTKTPGFGWLSLSSARLLQEPGCEGGFKGPAAVREEARAFPAFGRVAQGHL